MKNAKKEGEKRYFVLMFLLFHQILLSLQAILFQQEEWKIIRVAAN